MKRLKLLRYLIKPRPYSLERPIVIQFPVIDICNSACQMCNIWKNKKSKDLSVEELRAGLSNPLYRRVASIGINGGEPTLRKDLADLVDVAFQCLPNLELVSIISNAQVPRTVIPSILQVGEKVHARGGILDVMISLDGLGAVHDKVRGRPGNFDSAVAVIDGLKKSQLVNSLRIGCTIIRSNVYGLHDLLDFCIHNDLYVKFRMGIPHKRLYTEDVTSPYALTDEENYHVAEFLEGMIEHYPDSWEQKLFYRSLIDQLLHGNPRRAGCNWQHRGATITSSGELLYCAVKSDGMGLIHEIDSEAEYFSHRASLNEIVRNHCGSCLHDYSGLPPKLDLAAQMLRQIVARSRLPGLLERSGTLQIALQKHRLRRLRSAAKDWHTDALEHAAKRSPNKVEKHILVCGWYGTETLGDKAILAGLVSTFQSLPIQVRVSIASLNPYLSRITVKQMGELGECEILTVEGGMRRLHEVDLLVFGGGPLMGLRELGYVESLFELARHYGVPTAAIGCGVGPLVSPFYGELVSRILNNCNLRIYRDARSRDTARQLGIDTETDFVAEDPALIWLMQRKPSFMGLSKFSSPTVLMALREYPSTQYGSHLSATTNNEISIGFERAVVDAARSMVMACPEIRILPLPMCTNHFGGDDRWFFRRLLRDAGDLAANVDNSMLSMELSPTEYLGIFARSHAAVAMRFHSLVFAKAMDLPVIAIDYTHGKGKVSAFAEDHEIPSQLLQGMSGQLLSDQVLDLLRHPNATSAMDLRLDALVLQEIPPLLEV